MFWLPTTKRVYSVESGARPVGIDFTLRDARGCAPLDTEMLVDTEGDAAVVTIEDRMRVKELGGAFLD